MIGAVSKLISKSKPTTSLRWMSAGSEKVWSVYLSGR